MALSRLANYSSLLRHDLKALTDAEGKVLTILAENGSLEDVRSTSGLKPEEADAAVDRLKQLNYVNNGLKPTSYGLNAAAELKDHVK